MASGYDLIHHLSCFQISICVRWVYVEKGTTCYVKAYHGNPRNASNPLTPEDEEEFYEPVTEAPNSSNSTNGNETDSGDSDQVGQIRQWGTPKC